jgi:hypothetical protein
MFLQNLVILLLVAACLAYVGWHGAQAFLGRKSKLGSCCAKGCASVADDQLKQKPPSPPQFMPIENLTRNRTKPNLSIAGRK